LDVYESEKEVGYGATFHTLDSSWGTFGFCTIISARSVHLHNILIVTFLNCSLFLGDTSIFVWSEIDNCKIIGKVYYSETYL
jgi:hypothetical protein